MGAAAVSRIASAAGSTNATLATVGPAQLCFVTAMNAAAATRYLKLYDKASAPTVGTDAPKMTIAIPAGASFALDFSNRVTFTAGLAFALTTGAADSDTGALTAADIVGLNIGYA